MCELLSCKCTSVKPNQINRFGGLGYDEPYSQKKKHSTFKNIRFYKGSMIIKHSKSGKHF